MTQYYKFLAQAVTCAKNIYKSLSVLVVEKNMQYPKMAAHSKQRNFHQRNVREYRFNFGTNVTGTVTVPWSNKGLLTWSTCGPLLAPGKVLFHDMWTTAK